MPKKETIGIYVIAEYSDRSTLMVSYQWIGQSNESPRSSCWQMRVPLWKGFSKSKASPSNLRSFGSTLDLASRFFNCIRRTVSSFTCLLKSLHSTIKSRSRYEISLGAAVTWVAVWFRLRPPTPSAISTAEKKLRSRIDWALIPIDGAKATI